MWNTARAVSRAARQIVCRRRVRRVQQISSRHGWWVGHSTRPLCPLAQKGTDGEKHPPRQQAPPYRKAIWPPCRKRDLDLTMADGGEQPGFGKESLELEGGWSSKVPSSNLHTMAWTPQFPGTHFCPFSTLLLPWSSFLLSLFPIWGPFLPIPPKLHRGERIIP